MQQNVERCCDSYWTKEVSSHGPLPKHKVFDDNVGNSGHGTAGHSLTHFAVNLHHRHELFRRLRFRYADAFRTAGVVRRNLPMCQTTIRQQQSRLMASRLLKCIVNTHLTNLTMTQRCPCPARSLPRINSNDRNTSVITGQLGFLVYDHEVTSRTGSMKVGPCAGYGCTHTVTHRTWNGFSCP